MSLSMQRAPLSAEVILAAFRRDGFECRKCGTHEDLQVDHVIPVSKGGESSMNNYQTLCGPCNKEEGSRW